MKTIKHLISVLIIGFFIIIGVGSNNDNNTTKTEEKEYNYVQCCKNCKGKGTVREFSNKTYDWVYSSCPNCNGTGENIYKEKGQWRCL